MGGFDRPLKNENLFWKKPTFVFGQNFIIMVKCKNILFQVLKKCIAKSKIKRFNENIIFQLDIGIFWSCITKKCKLVQFLDSLFRKIVDVHNIFLFVFIPSNDYIVHFYKNTIE